MKPKKTSLSLLPQSPGVYRFYDATDNLIYVGKAKNIYKRVHQYFSNNIACKKTIKMVSMIEKIDFIITENENKAWILESDLIYNNKPKFNIKLKNTRSYPYIAVNYQHEYPRIFITWSAKIAGCKIFGPFVSKKSVYRLLDFIQSILQIRSCTDTIFNNRSRPCMLYEIKRCSGPCVYSVDTVFYKKQVEQVMEFLSGKTKPLKNFCMQQMQIASANLLYEKAAFYRDRIKDMENIYSNKSASLNDYDVYAIAKVGNKICVGILWVRNNQVFDQQHVILDNPLDQPLSDCLIKVLEQGYIHTSSVNIDQVRSIVVNISLNEINNLQSYLINSFKKSIKFIHPKSGPLADYLTLAYKNAQDYLARASINYLQPIWQDSSIKKALQLTAIPEKVECFDISHNQGDCAIASVVVFGVRGPVKKSYRYYNINPSQKGDDYESIYLAVKKRYCKQNADLPDAVLIDGGVGQLKAAYNAVQDIGLDIKIFAISKGLDRKAGEEKLHFLGGECIDLPNFHPTLHCLQSIRDEAHRYALTRHRRKLEKQSTESVLPKIKGIGPKKSQALLLCFGSVKKIGEASVAEIEQVPGVSKSLAQLIYKFFN